MHPPLDRCFATVLAIFAPLREIFSTVSREGAKDAKTDAKDALTTRHALVALMFSFLFCGCTPRPSTEPILIGHVAPFAGPDKALGEQAKQGIDLAVEEVNNDPSGGLLNRRVEVLHVNGFGDESTTADAAVRLITVN